MDSIDVKELKVKTVLTKSNLPIAGYSINPYVGCTHACRYCYARFMKRFTGHTEQWGTFLDVKYWEPIKNPYRYDGKTMIIGSVTDAYNPMEAEFCRTRAFLKEMQGAKINLIITTKSDLVLRDLDLIQTFPSPMISWSINTLDENFKNDMDKAVSIERRIAAMKECHERGIRTTCFISPILIEYIRQKHPSLLPLYGEIYNERDLSYWKALDRSVSEYAEKNGFMYVINKEPFLMNPTDKPIIINYFYHSEIKQSAKR